MKIALLVTGPQGVCGGAEALCDGLESAIQEAGHDVERIDVPCDESTFEGILEGYARAREMDLSRFDAVVSTKAPTYAVRHPRHVAYLVHPIRVFYDMFDSWTDGSPDTYFKRDRIRELDYEAFAGIPEGRRFAIGEEVASRLWGAIGVKATVIHPALPDSGRFHQGPFEHFLHVGRLHAWKRADLVIRAYRRARSEVPLLVAGTGPEEERLRELAGDDPRIRFLGHVSRPELIELYARALAVPFVPIREDFGYITIEAMLSGKPVITASDSGEAVRLVTETGAGLVVDPDPDELAAAMDRLAASTDEARNFGARGIERARRINWPEIVGTLLRSLDDQPRASGPPEKRKTRLLVVDSQPIEPPVGGGRLRLWGLYSHLPDDIEARYVGTYDWPGPGYRTVTHNGRLLEITVPQSREHFEAHYELLRREPKLTVDVTFPRLSHLSTAFVRRVRDEARWADIIVLSHPWVYPHLRGRPEIAGKPLLYDAQNVEGFLKRSLLSTGSLAGEIATEIGSLEALVCQDADVILACSNEDASLFSYLYEVPPAKLVLIPNGADTGRIRPAKTEEKAAARARFDLAPGHVVVLFVGSDYPPNIDAARFICTELAPLCPDLRFLLVGGCGDRLKDLPIPSNVLATGRVDDATRDAAYAAADLALNPMRTGGGTNIKMLDYLSAGLPVVSTPLGARGLDPAGNTAIISVPLKGFAGTLGELVADPERRRALARIARGIAEERYDWRQISNGITQAVNDLVQETRSPSAPVQAASRRARKPLRLAIMSTWETRCGIADYTGFLARALPPSVDWKIYAEETSCGVPDGPRVRRNWTYGLPDIELLRESLRRDHPDFLLVQHNPGFFREDGIRKLADLRDDVGVPIGITLHAGQALRMTPPVARDLTRFDRVFVHRPSDAGWLRDRGLTGNVDVFHHGVLEFPDRTVGVARAPTGLSNDSFVVGHFGYLRPHKGTLELIEAFDILAPHFPALRLLLLCSEYPSPDSVTYRSICDRRVAASPFRDRIDVNFRHLPIDQVALLLQACDLIVLPYWPTRESSSAAVRTAVSARRPILVSNSNIFEDIAECAESSADSSSHPVAEAIKRLMLDPNRLHRAAGRVRSLARHSAWHRVAAALSSDLILSVARTGAAIGENPTAWRHAETEMAADLSGLAHPSRHQVYVPDGEQRSSPPSLSESAKDAEISLADSILRFPAKPSPLDTKVPPSVARHLPVAQDLLKRIAAVVLQTGPNPYFDTSQRRYAYYLAATMDLPANSRILDVGNAPGHVGIGLHYLGFHVTGINLNAHWRALYPSPEWLDTLHVLEHDIEAAPFLFPDSSFDAILFTEVLEHIALKHPLALLQDLFRILKPGGLFLFSTPNICNISNIFALLTDVNIFWPPQLFYGSLDRHNREYTPSEVSRLLLDAGFVQLQIFGINSDCNWRQNANLVAYKILAEFGDDHPLLRNTIMALATKPVQPESP